jgi:hypothetical protein
MHDQPEIAEEAIGQDRSAGGELVADGPEVGLEELPRSPK